MKKRFTEEQIVRILREAEGSDSIREICRKNNITELDGDNYPDRLTTTILAG